MSQEDARVSRLRLERRPPRQSCLTRHRIAAAVVPERRSLIRDRNKLNRVVYQTLNKRPDLSVGVNRAV